MVRPPKNIQWWWSPQKPLKICNGLFTFLDPRYVDLYAFAEDVLQRIVEDISRCCLIFQSSLKYLDMILSSFGDMILTRDSIVNLKTIVDHCPQNFENHRKTIENLQWSLQNLLVRSWLTGRDSEVEDLEHSFTNPSTFTLLHYLSWVTRPIEVVYL